MSGDLVRYKKPPPAIPKYLIKKETLTLREKCFVWDDVIGGAFGLIILAMGFTWLAIPLTMQTVGVLMTAAGTLLTLERGTQFLIRKVSPYTSAMGTYRHSTNSHGFLHLQNAINHKGRAELCLIDRSRRNRPHRGEFPYSDQQYSIWPTFLEGEVCLLLVEHERPSFFQRPVAYFTSGRYWWAHVAQNPALNESVGQSGDQPGILRLGLPGNYAANDLEEGETFMDVYDKHLAGAEKLAAYLEAQPHKKAVNQYEGLAEVMRLRRTKVREMD